MIFLILGALALISSFHAFVMRSIDSYEYGNNPTTEWKRFEAEKVGSYHIF